MSTVEYVVFIIPTKLQIDLYTAILGTDAARDLLSDDSGAGAGAGAQLVLMSVLRKLCNSPGLLSRQVQEVRLLPSLFLDYADALRRGRVLTYSMVQSSSC